MKIATFNINNINKRIANLLAWLRVASPDAVCLQELKSTDAVFPIQAIRRPDTTRSGVDRGHGTVSRSSRATESRC
jgi:exonuclease III